MRPDLSRDEELLARHVPFSNSLRNRFADRLLDVVVLCSVDVAVPTLNNASLDLFAVLLFDLLGIAVEVGKQGGSESELVKLYARYKLDSGLRISALHIFK